MSVVLKKISEKEYLVGDNLTKLIDNNTISVEVHGEQTGELADIQEKANNQLRGLAGGTINYLIDLNDSGKNLPDARAKWKEMCEHDDTSKVAIFGLHPVAKVIASFVMGVTGINNQKFFKTAEDAKAWLNEK